MTPQIIHIFGRRCVHFVVLILAVLTTGCGLPFGDFLWAQEKSVPIGTANFQQCVTAAVADVHGVSINHELSAYGIISLNVKFQKPIPFIDVEVQHRGGNTALVSFSHKGNYEPDEDRQQITPLLQSITDAINRKCGIAKQQK